MRRGGACEHITVAGRLGSPQAWERGRSASLRPRKGKPCDPGMAAEGRANPWHDGTRRDWWTRGGVSLPSRPPVTIRSSGDGPPSGDKVDHGAELKPESPPAEKVV